MKEKIIYRKKLICLATAFSILLTGFSAQRIQAAESTQTSKAVQTFDDTATACSVKGKLSKKKVELGECYSEHNMIVDYKGDIPDINAVWDCNNKYNIFCFSSNSHFFDKEKAEIIIKRFDENLNLEKTIHITNKDFPIYGNAICDGEYYYIICGKEDTERTGSVPVLQFAKYDYNGNKINTCEITGYETSNIDVTGIAEFSDIINGTQLPFWYGSCKLAFQGNVLVCNYSKRRYDGHQSNDVLYINKDTMQPLTGIKKAFTGHAFDQAVISTWDGGYLFANEGDASPRAFNITYVSPDNARGEIDSFHFREGVAGLYQNVFARLGGLAETSKGYILCGSSENMLSYDYAPVNAGSGEFAYHADKRNLFVQVLKKDFYNYTDFFTHTGADAYAVKGETRTATGEKPKNSSSDLHLKDNTIDYNVKWLTDYGSDYFVDCPKIVSTNDGRVIILWEKRAYEGNDNGTTYYAIYDTDMNTIQPTAEIPDTSLADNADVTLHNNRLYWTTNDSHGQYINCLDISDSSFDLKNQQAKFKSCSVSLDGSIGLNMFAEVSDTLKNNNETYVSYTIDGDLNPHRIRLSSCPVTDNGLYKVQIPVSPAQINNSIRIHVECQGYTYADKNYSVKNYADYLLKNAGTNKEYANAASLVRSILNYGGYAQTYFNYRINKLANKGIFSSVNDPVLNKKTDIKSIVKNSINPTEEDNLASQQKNNSELKYIGYSLICDSEIKIRLYFSYQAGVDFNYVIKNSEVSVHINDKYYPLNSRDVSLSQGTNNTFTVTINNISILNLLEIYNIYITQPARKNDYIKCCIIPMQYIAEKADANKDQKLINLCNSIYFYYQDATEYKKLRH